MWNYLVHPSIYLALVLNRICNANILTVKHPNQHCLPCNVSILRLFAAVLRWWSLRTAGTTSSSSSERCRNSCWTLGRAPPASCTSISWRRTARNSNSFTARRWTTCPRPSSRSRAGYSSGSGVTCGCTTLARRNYCASARTRSVVESLQIWMASMCLRIYVIFVKSKP